MSVQMKLRRVLTMGVAGGALMSSGAFAQTAQPVQQTALAADTSQIEEIVVTARKREEPAQKTPIAISAFGEEAIKMQQINSVADLERVVPGFSMLPAQADVFGGLISLRGISTLNVELNQDPSVAEYVDGVYQGFLGTNLANAADVARIEVEKGPQGTTFGRNATGGAIQVIHNLPVDKFEGWVKYGWADNGGNEGSAMLNVPLVEGKLESRTVGGYLENDGYGHVVSNGTAIPQPDLGRPVNTMQEYNIAETLRFVPSNDLEVIGRASAEKGRSNGGSQIGLYMTPGIVNGALNPYGTANWEAAAELNPIAKLDYYKAAGFLGPACNAACQQAALIDAGPILTQAKTRYETRPSGAFENTDYTGHQIDGSEKLTGSLTLNYTIDDDLALKSITSIMRSTRYVLMDFGSGGFDISHSLQRSAANQITQEVQLNGTGLDGRAHYSAGVYYYSMAALDAQSASFFPVLFGTAASANFPARDHTQSVGPYEQATYALTDKINVTEGLRWTAETKEVNNRIQTADAAGRPVFEGGDYKNSSYNVSYLFSVDYSPIPNVMTYLKTGRGFVSGGQQETSFTPLTFAPEIVTDYELGVKSDLMDHHLRLNVDVYHEDYKNVQQSINVTLPNGGLGDLIESAADATIDGLEFQAVARPIDRLTLGADYAYALPHYNHFNGGVLGNLSSAPFSNTLRNAVTLKGDYVLPTNWGPVTFHTDWHWQSTLYFAPEPTIYSVYYRNGAPIGQGPYAIWNARVQMDVGKYDMEVAFYVKNIMDHHYYTYGFDGSGNAVSSSVGYVEMTTSDVPRTFGLEITKRF